MSAPFAGRLLVGLNGHDADVHVIRYASMVARLGKQAWRQTAPALPSPRAAAHDPEVRFVYLFPRTAAEAAARRLADGLSRSTLRGQVNRYFTAPPGELALGYDVLKGDALQRLSAFAADFDSDLLLLGKSTWPPSACARIVMEAPCPVWLVPPAWAPVLRRLLVPCDFSPRSADALRAAIEIGRRAGHTKCLVLHAYQTASRFGDELGVEKRRLESRYARFLAGIDTHGVTVEPIFVDGGRSDRQIERAAARHAVDLVVMSTRGRTRLASCVLASVTDLAIRRCQASFLVLRGCAPLGLVQSLWECLGKADDTHFS